MRPLGPVLTHPDFVLPSAALDSSHSPHPIPCLPALEDLLAKAPPFTASKESSRELLIYPWPRNFLPQYSPSNVLSLNI